MHAVRGSGFLAVSQYAPSRRFWQLLKSNIWWLSQPCLSPLHRLEQRLEVCRSLIEEDFEDCFLLIYFMVALIIFSR